MINNILGKNVQSSMSIPKQQISFKNTQKNFRVCCSKQNLTAQFYAIVVTALNNPKRIHVDISSQYRSITTVIAKD